MFKKRKKRQLNDESGSGEASIENAVNDFVLGGVQASKPDGASVEEVSAVDRSALEQRKKMFRNKPSRPSQSQIGISVDIGQKFDSSGSAIPAKYGNDAFATNEIDSEASSDKMKGSAKSNGSETGLNGNRKSASGGVQGKVTRTVGPLSAPKHLRVTSRFDYQPDVCKDYKETGYCGYGDSCIYMHDRSDYKSGWELEKEWESSKKSALLTAATGDGKEDSKGDRPKLPFACHICRNSFTKPVVTLCGHYFCQKCIFKAYRKAVGCPVCGKDTGGIFNVANILYENATSSNTNHN